MNLKQVIACTLGACAIMPISGSIRPASAQSAAAAGNTAGFQRWNSANEISFTGTIHEVATVHNADTLAGVNLQLEGTTSFQYANLGARLNSSVKAQLAAGQAVTLKGVVSSLNGQKVLVVRELTINQQTTHIRNDKGMIALRVEPSAYQGNRPRSKNAVNGGAQ